MSGDSAAIFHSIDLDTDEDDWWWATCACGWQSGPFPGRADAADAYGDHRIRATHRKSREHGSPSRKRLPGRHVMRHLRPFTGMHRRWFCRVEFKPQDLWVGAFWKRDHPWSLDVWVCLLPMVPLHFGWQAAISHGPDDRILRPVNTDSPVSP